MAGKTFDLVVLSSSPPEPSAAPPRINGYPPRRVAMLPSSPMAFSPPVSPVRPTIGASRTSSMAAAVPEHAMQGFATVGALVQSEYFPQLEDEGTLPAPQAQIQRASRAIKGADAVPIKKPRKPRTTKPLPADGVEKEKSKSKPRARKTKDQDDPTAIPELRVPPPTKSPFFGDGSTEPTTHTPTEVAIKLTKSGKPRKSRAKKDDNDGGSTAAVPKPTKPRVLKVNVNSKDGKKAQEGAAVTSAHFQDATVLDDKTTSEISETGKNPDTTRDNASIWDVPQSPRPKKKAAPKQRQPDFIAEGLDLDEAVMRRRDWTPPHDTTVTSPFADSAGKENNHSPPNAEGTFTNLLSNFAYAQSPPVGTTTTTTATSNKTAMAATKRRRVELMDIPGHQTNSRNSSPEKGKAPKKKPRTITDIVTEQYTTKELTPDPNAATTNFSDTTLSTTKVPLNDVSAPNVETTLQKPPRRRKTSKSDSEQAGPKAKTKRAPKKSAARPKPIAEKLLSPTSALSRLNRQDVLFGTSSQLALEESPTMLRQLQQAMKESEKDASLFPEDLAAPPRWPKLEKIAGRRSLWAESARDADGRILEHMEDVYIPEPDRTQEIPLLMDGTYDQPDVSMSFIDIDDIEPPQITRPTKPSVSLPAVPQVSDDTTALYGDDSMLGEIFEDIDDFPQEPPPSNQNIRSQYSFADIGDFSPPPAAQNPAPAPLKLDPPTATPMEPSPKKRRGRPPKSRSEITPATTTFTPTLQPPASKYHPTTKISHPPSTPPTASSRFIDIEEILDSEDEALDSFSPTPPRVHKFVNLPPLPLASFDGSPIKLKTKSPDSSLARIHRIPTAHLEWANIKATIFARLTTHIRSIPPTRDPHHPSWHEKILMYDPIVLEDFTVYVNANTAVRSWRRATQKQIKAWNADAKKRGDVGLVVDASGDEVLAVEKEVESWMVKAWCEALSVCCVNRVRGQGRARKGFY